MLDLNEEMLVECKKRLTMLQDVHKLHENVLKDYLEDGRICYSNDMGILYWLDNNPKYVEAVKKVEQESNIKVYFVIETHTNIGLMLSMLYVSPYTSDWPMDIEMLKGNTTYAYVENMEDSYCSEFGEIAIADQYGGLVRVF